jgi:hypothetical protein
MTRALRLALALACLFAWLAPRAEATTTVYSTVLASLPDSVELQTAATGTGAGTALAFTGSYLVEHTVLWTVSCTVSCSGTTIAFQGEDSQGNWVAVDAVQQPGATYPTLVSSVTPSGVVTELFRSSVSAFSGIRADITAYSAGTVSVWATAMPANGYPSIVKLDNSNLTSSYSAAIPGAGSPIGGEALSAEPTATTSTYLTAPTLDLMGRQVTDPYALHESIVACKGSGTSTSAISMTGTSACTAASGVKVYATSLQLMRNDSGTSAITVTLNDAQSSVFVLPDAGNGGSWGMSFPMPLAWAADTTPSCTASSGVTTLYCELEGFASKE